MQDNHMYVFFDENRKNHAIAELNVLPEETIAYPEDLSLGRLLTSDPEERNRYLRKLGCPAVNTGNNLYCLEAVLSSPEDAVFWISGNPHELSAFCMFCQALEKRGMQQTKIILCDALPDTDISSDPVSVPAGLYAHMWENALKENGILRTVADGKLITVPESIYDSYLDACSSPAEAVYRILQEKGILVSWYYLNDRFQKLYPVE